MFIILIKYSQEIGKENGFDIQLEKLRNPAVMEISLGLGARAARHFLVWDAFLSILSLHFDSFRIKNHLIQQNQCVSDLQIFGTKTINNKNSSRFAAI